MVTQKQKKAVERLVENRGNISKSMREAGYRELTAKNPKNLTESKGFKELVDKDLPNDLLMKVHKGLLKSTRIDHMVFPTAMKEKDIHTLLESVNCKVKKIMRGMQATHVWFWSPNDKARKEGLDMAYKLKGVYAPTKSTSLEVKLEGKLDDPALKELEDKYNELIRQKYLKGKKDE